MAGKDQVVPISILHQKVYPASRRMLPLVPLLKPETTKEAMDRRRREYIAQFRSQAAQTPITVPANAIGSIRAFTGERDYYHRFFYEGIMPGSFVCRSCNQCCRTEADLDKHTKCWARSSNAIIALYQTCKCIVCEQDADAKISMELNRVPLCGKGACIRTWKATNPAKFRMKIMELDEFGGED